MLTCATVLAISASADPIFQCRVSPCDIGFGWTARWDRALDVELLNIASVLDGRGRQQISLIKHVTFANMDQISIEFIGPATTRNSQTYFIVSEEITNKTENEWWAFRFDITDFNPIRPDGEEHPQKAHFHFGGDNGFTFANKLTKLPQKIDQRDSGAYTGTALAASAADTVGRGGLWVAHNLRMHDQTDPNPVNAQQYLPMRFVLKEQPSVPEPASIVLIGGGLVGLLFFRRLKTKPVQP